MGEPLPCLVVEDDDAVRTMVRHTLASEPLELLEAADGQAGWNLIERLRPPIVISDVLMPRLDGLDLLRRIRGHPELASTYVCLLTALGERERLLAGLEAGADDYLAKPFDPEELRLRVRNAARFVRLRRETERLAERLTEFYSVAAHEIRTPMAAMLSAAKVLLRYHLDDREKVERFARIIVEEGERLRRLIDDLLDLHRAESGELELAAGPVDLLEVARTVTARFRELAAERGVHLEVVGDALTVTADRDRIVQVLQNLVSNAIKHSPEGGTVTVRVERDGRGAGFAVEDRGEGVPEALRGRLFERFVSEARGVSGTGLGLAISRALVEAHGGSIGYEPRPGGGARFWVRLPTGGGEG